MGQAILLFWILLLNFKIFLLLTSREYAPILSGKDLPSSMEVSKSSSLLSAVLLSLISAELLSSDYAFFS